MGFFYVEAKSFDIRSEFRVGDGIRIAERCRGLFRSMFLSRLSVGWLRRSMEELWQGGEVREFYRTFQGGEGGDQRCIFSNDEATIMVDFLSCQNMAMVVVRHL